MERFRVLLPVFAAACALSWVPAVDASRTVPFAIKYWPQAIPYRLFDAPVPGCEWMRPTQTSCGVHVYANTRWLQCPACGNTWVCAYTYTDTYQCPITHVTDPWFAENYVLERRVCPPGFTLANDWVDGQPVNYRCTGPDDKTPPCPCPNPSTPYPVAIATGGKYLEEKDLPKPLEFVRYYTTRNVDAANLGKQWRHNYDRKLVYHSGSPNPAVVAYRADGRMIFFAENASTFVPEVDDNERLIRLLDGGGQLTGWRLIAADDSVETYSPGGKLLRVVTRTGYSLGLTYDIYDRLQSVTDNFGRSLIFAYDSIHRLASVTDAAGQHLGFGYDTLDRLVGVTYPDVSGSRTRTYLYQNASYANALTGITDENTTPYATYSYDALGRVSVTARLATPTQQVDRYSLTYGSGSASVTDPLGVQRTFSFQSVANVLRATAVSQAGSWLAQHNHSATTYDANGNVSSRLDFNGKKVCYSYDLSRNLETGRAEGILSTETCGAVMGTLPSRADVRKVSTQWHPTWRLPTKVAEPGRITTHAYNGDGGVFCAPTTARVNGNPIAVLCRNTVQETTDATGQQGFAATTTGLARVWQFTYDAVGQVLTATDPNNRTTTTVYYAANDPDVGKRANVQTITNPLGHVTRYTAYDANGRPMSIADPNGIVTALTYHPRGWLTSRAIGGESTTYVYDGVGQLTKVTVPDGSYVQYTYDGAHRLTQIQDGLGNRIVYTLDAMGNRIKEQAYDPSGQLARAKQQVFDGLNRLHQSVGAQ